MTPAKLNIQVCFFCYGGNGGIGMQLPEITTWWSKVFNEMTSDDRIGHVGCLRLGDVPLTMERNRAVKTAKKNDMDVLLMIDSDNVPDLYLGHQEDAKPFWTTSFDFLYKRKIRGLPTVVVAPYCGPPPHPRNGGEENVYVFYVDDSETGGEDTPFRFEAYSRHHAAQMAGIQQIAAGPTGCAIYSTDAFDLMPVREHSKGDILDEFARGEISHEKALRMLSMESWFFYEFTDGYQTQKASTEDVTNTREIQMAGQLKHKEPVVFCNWDAWAGHYKPKCVGKPQPIYMEQVNELYREAVQNNLSVQERIVDLDIGSDEVSDLVETDEREKDSDLTDGGNHDTEFTQNELPFDDNKTDYTPPAPEGVEITYRAIPGSPRVASVGHETPHGHLVALRNLVEVVSQDKDHAMRVIEVGSWVGESAIAMTDGFGSKGGTVYCVEHFEGNNGDTVGNIADVAKKIGIPGMMHWFKENVGDRLGNTIKLVFSKSLHAAGDMDPQEADIVFLDAGHTYEQIQADIAAWLPHVSSTGVICGHDYCDLFPGVIRAVDEMCELLPGGANLIDGTSVWFMSKKSLIEAAAMREQTSADEPEAIGSPA